MKREPETGKQWRRRQRHWVLAQGSLLALYFRQLETVRDGMCKLDMRKPHKRGDKDSLEICAITGYIQVSFNGFKVSLLACLGTSLC